MPTLIYILGYLKRLFYTIKRYIHIIILLLCITVFGMKGAGLWFVIVLLFPLLRYLRHRERYNLMLRTGVFDPIETIICGKPFRFFNGPVERWKAMRKLKRKINWRRSNETKENKEGDSTEQRTD